MSNKILSILIPYHNENENLFRPLLSSLNDQIGIDFNDIEIIISNNVEKHLIKDLEYLFMEYSNIYPQIKYIECPYKSSMGPNRQNAFDHATGKWAMYCDFDDVLYSLTSLKILLSELKNNEYDVYDFVAIKELAPNDKEYEEGHRFEINEYNVVLLHGKIFNIEFLRKNHIQFCHQLYAWEDMYYNQQIELCRPNRKSVNIPIYIWKYRAESVSKSEGTEWQYQCKYWVDSTAKFYYLIEFAAYYNLFPEEEFYHLLASIVLGWYQHDFELSLNPKGVKELQGAILKSFDPDLKILQYLPADTPSPIFPFDINSFCHQLIDNINVEEVFAKYNIGHFNDIPE